MWMLDWNQARFSIALSVYFLLPRKYQFLQVFIHFALLPRLIFENFKTLRNFFFIIPLFVLLIMETFSSFFSRYFLPNGDKFPTYSIVYFMFFLIMLSLNKKRLQFTLYQEILFAVVMLLTIYILILHGLSIVYFGRITEILLLVQVIIFIRNYKLYNYIHVVVFRLVLFLVGSYQLMTINGNIWRFFA
jgi:hypothetical protein